LGRKLINQINRLLDIPSDEIFMLVLFAMLVIVAGFSETIHVAEAIGALLVGLVIAETEHSERIEHLVVPFRDFFGAMFFFSFGLSIDPLALSGGLLACSWCRCLNDSGKFYFRFFGGPKNRKFPQGLRQCRAAHYIQRGIFNYLGESGQSRRVDVDIAAFRGSLCADTGNYRSFAN